MKQFLKWVVFILFAVTIGLVLSVAYTAGARAQSPVAVVQRAITQAPPPAAFSGPWGYEDWGGYGQTGVYTPTQSIPYFGYGAGIMGRGMMGGYGGGGMMGPGMHGGMMGGYGNWGYGYKATPQDTPAPVDEEIQLVAADFRFDPATVTVKAGEAVRLVIANQDGVPHNLYSPDVPIAYTPLPAGVIRSATFTAPTATGTYLAVCTFHPGMTLEIVVK
jgi:plastocyanin